MEQSTMFILQLLSAINAEDKYMFVAEKRNGHSKTQRCKNCEKWKKYIQTGLQEDREKIHHVENAKQTIKLLLLNI